MLRVTLNWRFFISKRWIFLPVCLFFFNINLRWKKPVKHEILPSIPTFSSLPACAWLSAHTCARVCSLTGTYLFISPFRPCRPVESEKDLSSSIYRMCHLHIFVVDPSARGRFCGGISSENQCCHGWMYVASTWARVGSPASSSHTAPIYMSPAGRGFPAAFVNLKAHKHVSQQAPPEWAGPPQRSASLPVSVCSPGPPRLFVYKSVCPDETESDKVMNTNFSNQSYLKHKM